MNAIVKMTGPHLGAVVVAGRPRPAWRVAVVFTGSRQNRSTVYQVLSYRRAVALSCSIAHDRKLHLHVEALPR